jgi:DNA-binding MarR family transcriptional regulator
MSPDDRRVVLATITPAGRDVALDATTALNQGCFGLEAIPRREMAKVTEMLRTIRAAVGDLPAGAEAT